ncbi:MAG: hypothetical protein R6V08_03820 [Desulfuromonadales bacterium]
MKKLLLLAFVVLLATITPGFAAPIGPLATMDDKGLFYGIGYSYVDTDWEPETEGSTFYSAENLETQQHQVQVHLGLNFAKGWSAYVGGGLSTIKAENAYRTSSADADAGADFNPDAFEDDFSPYGTAGFHGALYDGRTLDVGFFAQVNYHSEFEDEIVSTGDLGSGTESFRENFKLEMEWDGVAGLLLQGELEGALLYGGPIFYTSKADAESVITGQISGISRTRTEVEESESVGAVAGVRWMLKNDVSLDLELQKRSQLNVGLTLNKYF